MFGVRHTTFCHVSLQAREDRRAHLPEGVCVGPYTVLDTPKLVLGTPYVVLGTLYSGLDTPYSVLNAAYSVLEGPAASPRAISRARAEILLE